MTKSIQQYKHIYKIEYINMYPLLVKLAKLF
jgi:hypothetical protein